MVKDVQVGVLRRKRMEGKTQEAAAAAAGMSVRSARKWERGLSPSQRGKPHTWRTRGDPFAEVFDGEVVALLAADRNGALEATTILAELNRRHPGRFGAGQLRTLQRRVRQWRALNGPEKEVFFPQEHPPGREAAYDFTNCNELGITIDGAPFDHLLFELALSFSGWRWATVALSESFEALALGVQEALWRLGGVVEVLRSDNLSAATHELPLSGGRALTKRYRALLEHYGLRSTRIFPRKAHENGAVEQAHRRTKSILAQMLVLRGSYDFTSVESVLGARGDRARAQRPARRKAGRGTTASARTAGDGAARVHVDDGQGSPLEHDPGAESYLLGSGQADRRAGQSTAASRPSRGLLRREDGRAAAANPRPACRAHRLSSRDLVVGEKARRFRPLPLAGGAVPEPDLSARLRRVA